MTSVRHSTLRIFLAVSLCVGLAGNSFNHQVTKESGGAVESQVSSALTCVCRGTNRKPFVA